MSKFKTGDRVRIVEMPEEDADLVGLEGVVQEPDTAQLFLNIFTSAFDVAVVLDNRPDRFDAASNGANFFANEELELV